MCCIQIQHPANALRTIIYILIMHLEKLHVKNHFALILDCEKKADRETVIIPYKVVNIGFITLYGIITKTTVIVRRPPPLRECFIDITHE